MRFSKDYSKFEKEIFTSIRKNTRHSQRLGITGNSIKIQTPTQEFRAYIIEKWQIKKSQISEKLARSDADCTKAELVAMLEKWHGKEFDDFLILTFQKERPLPPKRALTVDEIISKYPMTVRILMVQLVEQIDRLKQPQELPEITEEWAGKKAKEIWQLIKDSQDEDLSDPALSLHYLGLSLDIVDSIIKDLTLKINKKGEEK